MKEIPALHIWYANGILRRLREGPQESVESLLEGQDPSSLFRGSPGRPNDRANHLLTYARRLGLVEEDLPLRLTDRGRAYADASGDDVWMMTEAQREILREALLADGHHGAPFGALLALSLVATNPRHSSFTAEDLGRALGHIAGVTEWRQARTFEAQGERFLALLHDLQLVDDEWQPTPAGNRLLTNADVPEHAPLRDILTSLKTPATRVWLIRAGREGEREPLALRESIAVIGWQDLGDISQLPSREELKAMVEAHYGGTAASVAAQAGQIYRFQQDVAGGDLVVLPLRTRPGFIALGRIAGPFEYRVGRGYDDDANYVRPVDWLATAIPYESFDDDLVRAFGQQGTLSEIDVGEDTAARLLAALNTRSPGLHLVLKWSPKYGANTIDEHREVAEERGAVWWSRVTSNPGSTGMKASRIEDFLLQIADDVATTAFLYSKDDVWKARMLDITADRSDVEEELVPPYYDPATHYNLWVKLADIEPSDADEIKDNYVLASTGQPVTSGGLGNQTPLVLRDRVGARQARPRPAEPKPSGTDPLTVAAVKAAGEAEALLLDDEIYARVVAALESGKHVILTGPPGTAKTTLAMVVASVAKQLGRCDGYVLTTATSDWTTYETIGGLKPQSDQTLSFAEGHFLAAIRANEWLVIDELNRSNFDRAFGQLFTVLSGQPVVLPYTRPGEAAPLVVVPHDAASPVDDADVLAIPQSWRVIATMNVFDKSLLFEMSFALMRRFALVEIPSPPLAAYHKLIDTRTADAAAAAVTKSLLPLREIKDVGPAVFIDMVRYAEQRRALGGVDDRDLAFELFYSYLLPQFEGLTDEDGDALFAAVAKVVGAARCERLRTTLNAVLGLELAAPPPSVAETGEASPSEPVDEPAA